MLSLKEIKQCEEIQELNINYDHNDLGYSFTSPYPLSTTTPVFTEQDIDHLRCPINGTIMNDPVRPISFQPDGSGQENAIVDCTYEREALSIAEQILVIPDTSKKLAILAFLEQEQYAQYRDEVPLPKVWKEKLCELICDKTSPGLDEQLCKIKKCLNQDQRLLTVPLNYTINHKILFNLADSNWIHMSSLEDEHSNYTSTGGVSDYDDDITNLLTTSYSNTSEEDYILGLDDNSSSDYPDYSQPHVRLEYNCSALYLAGLHGSTEVAKFLFKELKNANKMDIAIQEQYNLLKYHDITTLCFPYLDLALKETLDISNSSKEDFILWLIAGAKIDGLMHELSKIGNPNIEWLLSGLDVLAAELQIENPWGTPTQLLATQNSNGDTPLHVAIQNQHLPIVTILLHYGATVNAQNNNGDTPLHLAVQNNNSDLVKELLAYDAKKSIPIKNKLGKTPIYLASTENKNKILQLLVPPRFSNALPLHLAIQYRDVELLMFWLNKGIPLEAKNHQQQTPLYFAVTQAIQTNQTQSTLILCSKGANVTVRAGKLQQTIFHILANSDNAAVNMILLPSLLESLLISSNKTESALNIRDADGNTALHIAARTGNMYTFQLLLRNGANYSIPNKDDQTPNDIADRINARQINQEIILTAKQHAPPNLMLHNYNTQTSTNQKLAQHFVPFNKVLLNGNLVIFSDIVQIIDPNDNRNGVYLHNHNLSQNCIISLSNGNLASVDDKCTIYIWAIRPSIIYGAEKHLVTTLNGHRNNITSIQELSDNSLASIDLNGTIKIWDLNTQKDLHSIDQEDISIQCFALHSTATEQNLICGGEDTIHIWQLPNLSSNNPHFYKIGIPNNYPSHCLKIIHNNLFAAGFSNGMIQIFDLQDATKLTDYQHFNTEVYCITSYNVNPNTIAIISGYKNGTIILTKLSLATENLEPELIGKLHNNPQQEFHLFDCDTQNIVIVTKTSQSYATQHANFQDLIAQLAVEEQNQTSSCNVM